MPKELRSKKMRSMLARAKRRVRRRKRPGDGMMTSLVSETLPNGWHYQVEWVHDTRFAPKPWIVVYGFSPRSCGLADYFLKEARLAAATKGGNR